MSRSRVKRTLALIVDFISPASITRAALDVASGANPSPSSLSAPWVEA